MSLLPKLFLTEMPHSLLFAPALMQFVGGNSLLEEGIGGQVGNRCQVLSAGSFWCDAVLQSRFSIIIALAYVT